MQFTRLKAPLMSVTRHFINISERPALLKPIVSWSAIAFTCVVSIVGAGGASVPRTVRQADRLQVEFEPRASLGAPHDLFLRARADNSDSVTFAFADPFSDSMIVENAWPPLRRVARSSGGFEVIVDADKSGEATLRLRLKSRRSGIVSYDVALRGKHSSVTLIEQQIYR